MSFSSHTRLVIRLRAHTAPVSVCFSLIAIAITAFGTQAKAEPKPFSPSITATGDDEVPPLGNAPAIKSAPRKAATKPAPAKPEMSKPETSKPEMSKPEMSKPEASKAESTKPENRPLAPASRAQPDEPTPLELNAGESYQGVVPGSENLPPKPPKLPVAGMQRLTWCGFRIVGETPSVFVQTTANPDYQVSESKGELVLTFRNTKLNLRNNGRSLRTEAFHTDIQRVDVRAAKGKTLQVRIKTASKEIPVHREHVESSAGGFSLLTVEFPPGGATNDKSE